MEVAGEGGGGIGGSMTAGSAGAGGRGEGGEGAGFGGDHAEGGGDAAGVGGEGGGDGSFEDIEELTRRVEKLGAAPFVLVLGGLFDDDEWADFAFEAVDASDARSGLLAGSAAALSEGVVLASGEGTDLRFRSSSAEFDFERSSLLVGVVTGADLSEAFDFTSLLAAARTSGAPRVLRIRSAIPRCDVLTVATKLGWLGIREGLPLAQESIEFGTAKLNSFLVAMGGSPVQVLPPGSSERYQDCLRSEQTEFGCVATEVLDVVGHADVPGFRPGSHCYQVPAPAEGSGCPDTDEKFALCDKAAAETGCCNANFIFQKVFRADVSNQAPMPMVGQGTPIPAEPTRVVLDGSGLGSWYNTLPQAGTFSPLLSEPLSCFLGGTDVVETRVTRNPVEVSMEESARCAVNIALPGHLLEGRVRQCITDDGDGAYTQIIGTGEAHHRFAALNETLGPVLFSNVADQFKERVGAALQAVADEGKCCDGSNIVDKVNGVCPTLSERQCASDSDCAEEECPGSVADTRSLCDEGGTCVCAEAVCRASEENAECGRASDCSGPCADDLGRTRSWFCNDQCRCECSAGNEIDTGPEPPNPTYQGISIGDPHLRTFDGTLYDLQSVGELTLMLDELDGMEVQVRTVPWGVSGSVSVNSAVAVRVGADRLAFYGREEATLNGEPTTFTSSATLLPGGGSVVRSGVRHSVRWPDGSQVTVDASYVYLTVAVYLADGRSGNVVGLLGDFDGVPEAQVFTRDGTLLEGPIDFGTFYNVYAESWRVTQEESLFDYGPGETTETHTDRAFPRGLLRVADLNPSLVAEAELVCEAAGVTDPDWLEACILDVAATGDTTFADGYVTLLEPNAVLDVTPPVEPDANNGGALGSAGSATGTLLPGAKDFFSFTAQSGEGIQIRVVDVATGLFVPGVRVFDPMNQLAVTTYAGDVAYLAFVAALDGTYTVIVEDRSGRTDVTGEYRVYLTRAPGANENGSLVSGGVVAGVIDKGDLDSFTFSANVGEGVQLRLSDIAGSAFVPALSIYDPMGAHIASTYSADVAYYSFSAGATGTYTVIAYDWSSGAASMGSYDLYFTKAPGANEGGALTLSTVVTGTIDKGDLDSFTLSLTAGSDVSLSMSDLGAGSFVPALALYGPTGALLRTTYAENVATTTWGVTMSGVYTVVVYDWSSGAASSGSYSLLAEPL
jgi:hypothetical protein